MHNRRLATGDSAASDRSADGAQLYAGVDVGGTSIKLGVVDAEGKLIRQTAIPTSEERGPGDAARRIAQSLSQLLGDAKLSLDDVAGVGLATPGPLDVTRGMILTPGNLPHWRHSPIRDLVQEAIGLPVTLANDANAALFGEYWAGAGRAHQNLVLFTLGTGVGGGIMLNGVLVEGSHGCGAELGYLMLDCSDDAPPTALGLRGTLEGYCGAQGVVRRTEARLATGAPSTIRRRLQSDEQLTPLLVAEEAKQGDELAFAVVMETARYLAYGIVTAVHTVDPDCVLVGGAMTFGGPGDPLGRAFLERLKLETFPRLIPTLRDRVVIHFAELGESAGLIGAAGLARRERLRGEASTTAND